jgi:hypothetical protein
MKLFKQTISIALAGMVILSLGACGKKKNGSTNASTPASTCTTNAAGQLVDQYGRLCNNYNSVLNNSCLNARYNYQTGQYQDITTGAVVQCTGTGLYDGYNSIPYQGMYGNQMINGCSGWTQFFMQYYGTYVQYMPVDLGYGQRVCMNVAYLQTQNPGWNWNQYYTNYVNYGYPMYICSGYDCGGSYYGNYQYSCNSGFNFGAFFGGFGFNVGACY